MHFFTLCYPYFPAWGPSNFTERDGLSDGQVSGSYQPTILIPSVDDDDDDSTSLGARNTIALKARNQYRRFRGGSAESSALRTRISQTLPDSSGDALQPRQGAARVARLVVKGIIKIVKGIIDGVKHDNEGRGQFTQDTVANGRSQYPDFNWVVVHTKHETDFDGVQDEDWGHQHQEFDIEIGGTIGYEIYWFRSGTFKRQGDGGFLNWAWGGAMTSTADDGATVTFVAPT
ncbi:hypothetical protein D9756_003622 [Leucocoprinus leucothites]|uniref:Uncharacterized protein n=1 Tax=Leucocoprinus leucothites TaxID=201217 RepID=A0A8H5G6R5_9AGAR|nr:hypothetical protein D9756_003622 [Leucoagaricus leucothites]